VVLDGRGRAVYETALLVAPPPTVTAVSPAPLVVHAGPVPGALRVSLLTPDAAFFAAFEARVAVLNRTFPVHSDGRAVYFDLELGSSAPVSQRLDRVPVSLTLASSDATRHGSPELLCEAPPVTVYLLAAPELLALGHNVLYATRAGGEDLEVEARYFAPGALVEMSLSKVQVLPVGEPRPGTGITLRPSRVEGDSRAVFRVPAGLQSGVYAVSVAYAATQRRSAKLYLLAMQHEVGEGSFLSVGPGDGILPEGFRGELNATLRRGSEGAAVDLPMLDLLAERRLLPLTRLVLGCELVFGLDAGCPGSLAVQRSREEYACHVDLRRCSARAPGDAALPSGSQEVRLAFTVLSHGEGGHRPAAAPLMRSPPLRYLPAPRLAASLPSRLPLPLGYPRELAVAFGRDGVLHVVPGRTYCILHAAGPDRVEAAPLEGAEEPVCRFAPGQLDRLARDQSTPLRLLLANNLADAGAAALALEDPHGLANLVDTGVEVVPFDSPFFRPDAVARGASPAALFESQPTIVEFTATSGLWAPAARFERYRELELWCRLYDTGYSSVGPRLETQDCSFSSSRLSALRVKVGAGVLRAGSYRLAVALGPRMPTEILGDGPGGPLRVLPRPRLSSVYPHYLESRALGAYGHVYLLGSDFLGLRDLGGTLACALSLSEGDSPAGSVSTSLAPAAAVLSDRVIACPVSPAAARVLARRSQVPGLRASPTLSLSTPTELQQAGPPLDVPLLTAPGHATVASFELAGEAAVLGAAPPSVSAYSQAEAAAAEPSLRTIVLHAAPSKLLAAAAEEPTLLDGLVCQYSADRTFADDEGAPLAEGRVVELLPRTQSADYGQVIDAVRCEFPVMSEPGEWVYVRLRVELAPTVAEQALLEPAFPGSSFPRYAIASQGSAQLQVMALPVISGVRPAVIFNLAAVTHLAVTGESFSASGGLLCILSGLDPSAGVHRSRATLVGSHEAACPFAPPASLLRQQTLYLGVSNDDGLTQSESPHEIRVRPALPRILGLTSPRVLIGGARPTLTFSGVDLGSLGSPLHLALLEASGEGADRGVAASGSCTPSLDGASLECADFELPGCLAAEAGSEGSCPFGLRLLASDRDPATLVRQALTLGVLPPPTLLALDPAGIDSTRACVKLFVESPQAITQLAGLDSAEGCCLEPAGDPQCSSACRAVCQVFPPGRASLFPAPLQLDAAGDPCCSLPTYGSALLACSGAVTHLEVEVVLDSYFTVPTLAPPLECHPDTAVAPPSVPWQALYQQPEEPLDLQRVSMNGTHFRPGADGERAACHLYDSTGALALSLRVAFLPERDPSVVHCLLAGSRELMGALRVGSSYTAKYVQDGGEHAAAYQVLVLARPRLLSVLSRLVSAEDEIVVRGAGFSPHVAYLCHLRSRPSADSASAAPSPAAEPLFVPALRVLASEVACPAVASGTSDPGAAPAGGVRCLEVLLKDPHSGFVFRAEPGSPAESLASPCLIAGVDALVAAAPLSPARLPLAESVPGPLPVGERILRVPLAANSAVLELPASLGAPFSALRLRFENVAVGADQATTLLSGPELAALAAAGQQAELLAIECAPDGAALSCAPWPYVPAVGSTHRRSALTLSLVTSLNAPRGAIDLPLSQEIEFFVNPTVASWSPVGSLLESVDRWVAVRGSGFVDSASLECLYYVLGSEALGPFERGPADWVSATELRCLVPDRLFRQVASEVDLRLSLDGGSTHASLAGAETGPAMQFALRRAPQVTRVLASTPSGEPVTKSLFVGRPEVLTLGLEGAHFLSAADRGPHCKFTADTGQVLLSAATVLDQARATCDLPPVPASLEPGLRTPGRYLVVSLVLEADNAEFSVVGGPAATPAGLAPEDHVRLLRAPAVLAASVAHPDWGLHGTLATLDQRAVRDLVARDPDAELVLTLELSDIEGFAEAVRHDRLLQVVVAPAAGQAAALTSPVALDLADPGSTVSARLRGDLLLAGSPPPLGAYRVGLVPLTEVSPASEAERALLVAGDAPALLVVDSAHLVLEALPATPSRLPTAPGFANHLPVRVSGGSSGFGAELAAAVPLLRCALVSKATGSYPAGTTYLATHSLAISGAWGSGASPAAVEVDFVFEAEAEKVLHEGLYCVRLVFNGLLAGSPLCEASDLEVTVFHLPPNPDSRAAKPCNVARELADFTHFGRNFAARVAVVDGALQYDSDPGEAGGALLCDFDARAYDYLEHLHHLELWDRPPAPWELQAALTEATGENVTALALASTAEQLAGKVFFRAHLVEIVDEHLPAAPDGLPSSGVFHPGETVRIRGFFLDSSPAGAVLRLTHLEDPTVVVSGLGACGAAPGGEARGQLETWCVIPPSSSFSAFGEFLVGLEERGTGQLLSDDHGLLVLLVLPVPEILTVAPGEAVVSSLTERGEAARRLLRVSIDFGWGPATGTQALEAYRQSYLAQVRCRLGALGAPLSTNVTWTGPAQLACYFSEPTHLQTPALQCVEVSLNGGRTFATDCPRKVGTARAPVVTGYAPTLSLLADPTTIVLSGVGFEPLLRYWCLFSGPGADESLQEATYRSGGEIECQKPLIGTTAATHDLELSLYFSPAWPAGGQEAAPLLVKRFLEPHRNQAYASLVSVTPDRGDSLGGTPLEVTLDNNPFAVPGHAGAISCRFSAQIAGSSSASTTVVDSPASMLDEQRLGCETPDFSAHFSPQPPASSVQEVYLSVSELDGTFRRRSELRFRYVARPEVLELAPSRGFATRVTQVQVRGRHFLNFDDLAVRAVGVPPVAGVDVVELTWQGRESEVLLTDPGTLLLDMPAAATPGSRRSGSARTVRFEISLNGGTDWTTGPEVDPPLFTFLDEPQVVFLSHRWSNLRGGFPLTVRVLHLRYRAECPVPAEMADTCAEPEDVAYCRIGERETVLRHVNATHAECLVPAQAEEMAAPVALRTLGGAYFGAGNPREAATLLYTAFTRVTGLRPAEGPVEGGQLVAILGTFSRIPEGDTLAVAFGEVPVLEVVGRTASEVTVRAPPITLEAGEERRLVTVAVLWERTGLLLVNESAALYTYRSYPVLDHVWPTHGPAAGGTLVELRGAALDQEGLCRLASASGEVIMVQPLWISPELLLCEAPRHPPEELSLELEFGDGAHVTSTGLTYTFDPDPHIHASSTSHLALSANRVGVRIGLTGLHFLDTPDLGVRVGDWVQPATYISPTELAFTAPPVREAGRYAVALTTNAVDFTWASTEVTLTFHGGFALERLSLTRLQVEEGATLSITALGQGLPTAEAAGELDFYCVLGPLEPAGAFEPVALPASLVSVDGTSVRCDGVPAAPSSGGVTLPGPYSASLAFSYDLQELLWPQRLEYYPAPALHSVGPARVSQGGAELLLTVAATGLVDGGEGARCRLDPLPGSPGSRLQAARVLYLSSSSTTCTFGAVPNGHYSLALASNGAQYVTAGTTVRVLPALQILDVDPPHVLRHTPGQALLVQATNLADGAWCIFEEQGPALAPFQGAEHSSPGVRLADELLACAAPRLVGSGVDGLNLKLALDPSPRTKSQSAFLLRVTDQCPPGYSCQGGEVAECPPGHQCRAGALAQPPRRCPIGAYQGAPASSQCRPCPSGSMCPWPAMAAPLPCPAGFTCSALGGSSPDSECPEGHYCLAGSERNDPFLTGLLTRLPHLCTTGSSCRPGMRTGVVLQHANSSAPAPCTHGAACGEGSADAGGLGPCPAGSYCPTPRHSGIPCPPRHYCPGRGNPAPLKCPRGTFNMHSGQQNCTACPLGRICPVEGLFLPVLCPPGYACNQEQLSLPINLCKIGHVCLGGVMSGTLAANRSCTILKTIGGYDQCDEGVIYKVKEIPEFSAQALPAYFFERTELGEGKVDACCWSADAVAAWVESIGLSVGQHRAFRAYRDRVRAAVRPRETTLPGEPEALWDGMRIVDKALFRQGLDPTDQLAVPMRRHRDLLALYAHLMYTRHQADLCPGGLLCLDGVNTHEPGGGLASTPYPCPSGSYCLAGSDSVIGTGLCPIGYSCPEETTYPVPARPGSFTGNFGAVEAQPCPPGTFQLEWRADGCDACPAGHQCKDKGTSMPIICPVGYYRSVIESNVCSPCPKGTFSFERGSKDPLECQECPPGRICEAEGSANVSTSSACTDGAVCRPGTGAKAQPLCPAGYYCPPQTSEASQYDYRCEAGFFCRSGTGESTKTRDTCPQSYYCPPGTRDYDYSTAEADYSRWATDAPTRCPQGTGLDGVDTKKHLLECRINEQYRLLGSDLDVRPASTGPGAAASTGGRRLTDAEGRGRMLAAPVASKSDPRLRDLFEVDFELGEVEDKPDTPSPIRAYINADRQYVARWSPLKLDLLSPFLEVEALDAAQLETDSPGAIFDLPPSAYALVTLDLRHIAEETREWTYGEDWAISFTLAENLTLGDLSSPTPMPEQFLAREQPKSQALEFTVFAWRHLRLRVDVLCYNALYLNFRHLFMNTTSVEVRRPSRAVYGSDRTFAASIVNGYQITLPYNQPKRLRLTGDPRTALPSQAVAFAHNPRGPWSPVRHRSTPGRNVWVPASRYWNARPRINLPYLPYFSNCRGYGNFIPFWSLVEQHYACELVPYEDTRWMTAYSFGERPRADICEAVLVNCVYDEVFLGQQPLPRWFAVEGGAALFDLSVAPVVYDDLIAKDFAEFEVLPVAPEEGAGEDGVVPKTVGLAIDYYQVDGARKELIAAGLAFEDLEALTPDELVGTAAVGYNLTFSFAALSHMELTVAFAFSWDFYLVLYVIVGVLALVVMVVFAAYHRLVARPKPGQPIAALKFGSYLALTIPPAAEGTGLAMLPVTVADFVIAAVVTGRVFQVDTRLFHNCDEPEGDVACVLTLFDLIKDEPGSVSVDYGGLRTGRCGTALMGVGLYLMRVSLVILIPDQADVRKVAEAHDGNTWEYYTWKRSNMLFASLYLSFLLLAIIQFSFADVFGTYIWEAIACLKALALVVDHLLEQATREALLVAPLSAVVIVVLGLVTFGAEDFLDFLDAFFIELGIMMFERAYLSEVVGLFFEYVSERLPKAFAAVQAWFSSEDDAAEAEEAEAPAAAEAADPAQKAAGKEGAGSDDSSDAEVFYSEEESALAHADDDLVEEDPDLIVNAGAAAESQDSKDGSGSGGEELSGPLARMEDAEVDKADLERRRLERARDGQSSSSGSGDGSEEEEAGLAQGAGASDGDDSSDSAPAQAAADSDDDGDDEEEASADVDLDEDAEAEAVEPLIGAYAGYANDTLALLYTPLFVALLWAFYEETVVAQLYGIPVQAFVFYFLFSLVIVPAQILVDVLFLNVVEWYHRLPLHDYLDYMAHRFKTRKASWKGKEPFLNRQVAADLRSLDQLCFSAQHYFVQTLYVAGMCQVVLGIQVLLWAPGGYNVFADLGTVPILLSAYALCAVLERACIAGGRALALWQIDESVARLEGQEDAVDLAGLFAQLEAPARQAEQAAAAETPGHVKFHASQWRVVEQARAEEDALKHELASDRVAAQTFRDMFLQYNRPWLQGQLHEVFTPRTLFLHRKQIIEQFQAVMDELAPDVSLSEGSVQRPESDSATGAGGSEGSESSEERKRRRRSRARLEEAPTAYGPGGRPASEELAELRARLTPATATIARYWLTRTRFVATLRAQVQAIVDLHIEDECLYCGATAGLSGELLQDIEELFHAFLRDTGEARNLPHYKYQQWIRYFKSHAQFRTLCAECAELIADYHRKLKRRARRKARAQGHPSAGLTPQRIPHTPQPPQGREGRPETETPQEAAAPLAWGQDRDALIARIRALGPGPRAIITRWINLMRASLGQKLQD